MVLPIIPYGNPILRQKAINISLGDKNLPELLQNMWETMHAAEGVGLAAPQIGLSIRVFIIDSSLLLRHERDEEGGPVKELGYRGAFINPTVVRLSDKKWEYKEGCLSIPHVAEYVSRSESVTLDFFDEHANHRVQTFSGLTARVILHEYDHIEGILFPDRLASLRRKLLSRKLSAISKGKFRTQYTMLYP